MRHAAGPPDLLARYAAVRARTLELAAPLEVEDQVVQSMPDASPTRWHLAHTTWFFEAFVLEDQPPHDPAYAFLFNSYYESLGERWARHRRGVLSRPTVAAIHAYREDVDERMRRRLEGGAAAPLVELGLQHEQQHQELILTDIKHALAQNPLDPVYLAEAPRAPREAPRPGWIEHPGGVVEIGHEGEEFAFDNETPRHEVLLRPFRLAAHPVDCAHYLEFIADGGYSRPELWLSAGWATALEGGWEAPLYWRNDGDEWSTFTLHGRRALLADEPVAHLSFFEADAFARWADARLPLEAEWEVVARDRFRSSHVAGLHPQAVASGSDSFRGGVWEWTSSPYVGYPGYSPLPGAVGEYNGKFMSGQMVLRGGSAFTPADHVRATYRNFFPPEARWQLSGLRLAQ